VFSGNINSKETTQECCEVQGFYWSTSNGRCYKCNPNESIQEVFINGVSTQEYITYNGTQTSPITSLECCNLTGGTLITDENGNIRCIIPPPPKTI